MSALLPKEEIEWQREPYLLRAIREHYLAYSITLVGANQDRCRDLKTERLDSSPSFELL